MHAHYAHTFDSMLFTQISQTAYVLTHAGPLDPCWDFWAAVLSGGPRVGSTSPQ
jgi:hypothetical protein